MGRRLHSWKEIAAHLNYSVSTVQRWERQEGLPVQRHQHEKRGAVWAYADEVDRWWEDRGQNLEGDKEVVATKSASPVDVRVVALVAAVVAVSLVFLFRFVAADLPSTPTVEHRTMLAVLPFENLNGDIEGDVLSSGLTEELITRLALLDSERLGVIARTSVLPYQSSGKGIREIGDELGVDYILEGSLRGTKSRLRITSQLISVEDRTHVWAETYDRELDDLLELEEEISRKVAESLSIELLGAEKTFRRTSLAPDAHIAYLRGRFFWNWRTQDGLKRAIEEFRRAIDQDPGYAQAHAGLADSFALLSISADAVDPREARDKALSASQTALELDSSLAEAHASLGIIYSRFDWDWEAAEAEFARAIELNANYASAHQWYGVFLTEMGRFAEAEAMVERALALDPLSPILFMSAGMPRQYGGNYEEALRFYDRALELSPDFVLGHRMKGMTYLAMGDTTRAKESLQAAREIDPEDPHALAELGYVCAKAKEPERAIELLAELTGLAQRRHVTPYDFALLQMGLGNNEEALQWLERGYEVRAPGIVYLGVDPIWDPLRSDRKFRDLLERMDLPH